MKRNGTHEFDRVRRHTRPEMIEKIDRETQERIRFYAAQPQEVISRRIEELEREWDMERWLETNASTLALTGVVLGFTQSRKWLLLSTAVLGFLLQHAVQGWCPPIGILRKLGVRTQTEIDREIYALKWLRGDFQDIPAGKQEIHAPDAEKVFHAVAAT